VALKIIIRESDVDTQATASFIRSQLTDLAPAMESVGSDIEKFNQHVRNLLRGLRRRRQRTDEHDLIANLFKGYKAASDEAFIEYIVQKEEEYEEGTKTTPDRLMALALDKYAHRVRSGKWKKPSEQTAKLLAMEARLEKIQLENKKLKAEQKGKSSRRGDRSWDEDGNDGEENSKSRRNRQRPSWMFDPPASADKKKAKKVDGKTYHWCDAAKVWGTHTANKCRAGKEKHHDDKESSDKKKIKFSKALQAVAEDDNVSNESEE